VAQGLTMASLARKPASGRRTPKRKMKGQLAARTSGVRIDGLG